MCECVYVCMLAGAYARGGGGREESRGREVGRVIFLFFVFVFLFAARITSHENSS